MTSNEAIGILEAELPAIHERTYSALSDEMLGASDLLMHTAYFLHAISTQPGIDNDDRAQETLTALSALIAKAYGMGRRSMLQ